MRQLTILTLTAIVLTACNMGPTAGLPTPNDENIIYLTATVPLPTANAEGVIVITATSDAPVVAQAQNTPVILPPTVSVAQPTAVIPTAPSVPTVPVNEQLDQAAQYLQNGYFEEAVQTYDRILQGTAVDSATRAEAAFRMGQAALKEGLFPEAVTALSVLIDQIREGDRVAQAYFLRGDAYLGLSQWQNAINDFQQYLTLRPGLVDSYVYERIADAQLALGLTTDAVANYNLAVETGRPLVPQLAMREKVAQIYIGLGQVEAAVAQYDAILAVARNAPYRAAIELAAGKALYNAGQTEAGLLRLENVFDNYQETTAAYEAMTILLNNGAEINGLQRGRVAFNYGDYQQAITAFNDYSSNYQLDMIPTELYLMLGRAYREIGSPDAAFIAFQTIVDQFPTDPLLGEALLEQGRTRFLSGDIPGAIQTYKNVAERYAYLNATASEALWRVGYLYGTNGDPVQSRQVFTQLAQTYPQSTWATNGLLLAASAAVKSQEWQVAENLYARIATLATGDDQAAAYFWVGRLAQERGDTRTAVDAYDLAKTASPDSYFAARARDIQVGRRPFQADGTAQFTFDDVALQAEAENWLRQTFAIETPGDLSALSATLASDPRVIRGTELWVMGAYEEAVIEFASILDDARASADGLTAYQMALYLQDLGAYYYSIVAAADVITSAGVGTLEAPRFIARMRYPAYYVGLVQMEAQKYQIDPLLVLSLIRQESLFSANALSSAAASGLMQVIPSTGQYIANKLGYQDFRQSDLSRPRVSVEFGTFYLDEQLRLFDGNVAAALAAYNGGPGNALDWVALAGGDVDLLVTTITFDETRSYVQRIYSHYSIYRELYTIQ